MRQPKPPDAIEELRDFLSFAVPLRSADLAYKIRSWRYSRTQAITWLTSEAEKAGISLGGHGDSLQFSDPSTRTGRARDAAIRTADDLVGGIAAAALLAQLEGHAGVTAFGDYYGIAGAAGAEARETHPGTPTEDPPPPRDGAHPPV
ncbi:hypothetical protein ACF09G_36140 [Streptomyces albogriseolus]|uniref:hypothetical protein n=1 Tax=Streptomyces albogriseolus TaxID=1887 RepID=UPI0019A14EB7|nr:hypothetical protein [Streptomyces sp.]